MSGPEQKSVDPLGDDDPFADAAVVDDLSMGGSGLGGAAPLASQQAVQPRTQKPRSNVYTMMLILSLAAIVTSCIVLYLHLQQFGDFPWWEIPADVTTEVGA